MHTDRHAAARPMTDYDVFLRYDNATCFMPTAELFSCVTLQCKRTGRCSHPAPTVAVLDSNCTPAQHRRALEVRLTSSATVGRYLTSCSV